MYCFVEGVEGFLSGLVVVVGGRFVSFSFFRSFVLGWVLFVVLNVCFFRFGFY